MSRWPGDASALDQPLLGLFVEAGVGLPPAAEAVLREFEIGFQGCEATFLLAQRRFLHVVVAAVDAGAVDLHGLWLDRGAGVGVEGVGTGLAVRLIEVAIVVALDDERLELAAAEELRDRLGELLVASVGAHEVRLAFGLDRERQLHFFGLDRLDAFLGVIDHLLERDDQVGEPGTIDLERQVLGAHAGGGLPAVAGALVAVVRDGPRLGEYLPTAALAGHGAGLLARLFLRDLRLAALAVGLTLLVVHSRQDVVTHGDGSSVSMPHRMPS